MRTITAAILALALTLHAQDYILTRYAGAGPQLGDGGPALKARFASISAFATGVDGSIYIADPFARNVRRLKPDGTITTVAGTGILGNSGDGGPATSARLNNPSALAVDRFGQLYIGDSGSHTIRKVAANGIITTIAGNGQAASITAPIPLTPSPATSQPINSPSSLAFLPSGDLLVADYAANVVLQVSVLKGTIARVAGGGSGNVVPFFDQPAAGAALGGVSSITVDQQGNYYILEIRNQIVRRVDPDGNLTRVLGSGGGASTSSPDLFYGLSLPNSILMDSTGIMYVSEYERITRWDSNTHSAQVIAGSSANPFTGDGGPPLSAGMHPSALALDSSNNLLLADTAYTSWDFNTRIRKVAANVITTVAGGYLPNARGDSGPAHAAELYLPQMSALGLNGELYIADASNYRIRRVNPNGSIATIAGSGVPGNIVDGAPAAGSPLRPTAVAVDPSSGQVFLASYGYTPQYIQVGQISKVDSAGVLRIVAGSGSNSGDNVPVSQSALTATYGLTIDPKENVYFPQYKAVREINAATSTVASVPAVTGVNLYITTDVKGTLYVASSDLGTVTRILPGGSTTVIAGGGTSTSDGVNARSARLQPQGIAVDAKGNLFIAEPAAGRVRMVDASTGQIRTIAGGALGFGLGENGPATQASLNYPLDVKVDSKGNVFVTDSLNMAVYRLSPASATPPPAISAIENEASQLPGIVAAAPGERVEIVGPSLAGPVSFDEFTATILSTSPLIVQIPPGVSGRPSVQVTAAAPDGTLSAPVTLPIVDTAPAIYPGLTNSDGTPNTSDNPAPGGSTLNFHVTGEGLVDDNGSPLASLSVQIAGLDALVLSALDSAGILQVQVTIPAGLDPTQPSTLTFTAGSAQSQDGVVVWAGDPSTSRRTQTRNAPSHLLR